MVVMKSSVFPAAREELLESSEKYSSFIKLREEAASWKMQSA